MTEPIKLDDLLADTFGDIESTDIELLEPDELDETEPIDESDYAEKPEFSDFVVWCPETRGWEPTLRDHPAAPWHCYVCGATDHTPRDHEGAGA